MDETQKIKEALLDLGFAQNDIAKALRHKPHNVEQAVEIIFMAKDSQAPLHASVVHQEMHGGNPSTPHSNEASHNSISQTSTQFKGSQWDTEDLNANSGGGNRKGATNDSSANAANLLLTMGDDQASKSGSSNLAAQGSSDPREQLSSVKTAVIDANTDEEDRQLREAIEKSIKEQGGIAENSSVTPLVDDQSIQQIPLLLPGPANEEDDELQRAIALSLQPGNGLPTSSEQFSVSDLKQPIPNNPAERKRKPDAKQGLVGIRNVGNTCYLNSMLQMYFALPSFRCRVFRFRAPVLRSITADSHTADQSAQVDTKKLLDPNLERERLACRVVWQLQGLFGRMALSTYSYVDPSDLISAMQEANPGLLQFGGQQDATEFNHIFLDLLESGFNAAEESTISSKTQSEPRKSLGNSQSSKRPVAEATSSSPVGSEVDDSSAQTPSQQRPHPETNPHTHKHNIIRSMFTTRFIQELVASDGNVLVSSSGETNAFILDATGKAATREVYRSIDDYVSTDIDYRPNEASADTDISKEQSPLTEISPKVKKNVWFTHVPDVVTMYLQRVKFNREKSEAEKVHEHFDFHKQISLGRYFLEHKIKVSTIRRRLVECRAAMEKLQQELEAFEKYPVTLLSSPLSSPTSETRFIDGMNNITVESTQQQDSSSTKTALSPGQLSNEAEPVSGITVPMEVTMAAAPSHSKPDSIPADQGACQDSIVTCFQRVLRRVADTSGPFKVDWISDQEIQTVTETLEKIADHDVKRIQSFRSELGDLRKQERSAYTEFQSSAVYDLFAVLVHDGVPLSGHYWVYIRDLGSNLWYKYNDMVVGVAEEDEMWTNALGGNKLASAYCLIYVSSKMRDAELVSATTESLEQQARRDLPFELVQRIDGENDYLENLIAYSAAKNIVLQAEELLKLLLTAPSSSGLENFYMFLLRSGFYEDLVLSCVRDAFQDYAEKNIKGSKTDFFTAVLQGLAMSEYPLLAGAAAAKSSQTLDDGAFVASKLSLVLSEDLSQRPLMEYKPFMFSFKPQVLREVEMTVCKILGNSVEFRAMSARETDFLMNMYSIAMRALMLYQGVLEALLSGDPLCALNRAYCLIRKAYLNSADQDLMTQSYMAYFHSQKEFEFARRTTELMNFLPIILVSASDKCMSSLNSAIRAGNMGLAELSIQNACLVAGLAIALVEFTHPCVRIVYDAWSRYIQHCKNDVEVQMMDTQMREAKHVSFVSKLQSIEQIYFQAGTGGASAHENALPPLQMDDHIRSHVDSITRVSKENREYLGLIAAYESHLSVLRAIVPPDSSQSSIQAAIESLHQLTSSGSSKEILIRYFV